ncbi:MAG: LytTR family transcriptional regulator DNA-binding domain-containing protein, partial [Oscillospiraceae bacterium]|nr:LytTR family transcriptional regulator DNA-binding domain-containing protein [Oscillospiraceae bacterium]
ELPITDVLYIESVDNRTFLYTDTDTYETREKLYHLEDILREKHFLRISKSMLLNLMKLRSVRPALNGRFSAILSNGEEVIISRKYVSSLKETLRSS